MVTRDNFVDSLRFALDLLKWSPEHLADHLSDKYSVEYLRSVCEGRPIGEVERDVVVVLVRGLADKLTCSIIMSKLSDSEKVGQAAREAFIRIVNRFDLHLRDITRLAEIACSRVESAESFRTQTVGIFDVDFWDSVLGNIARELSQGTLFQSEQTRVHSLEGLALVFDSSTPAERTVDKPSRTHIRVTRVDECWYCRRPTENLTTSRCHCGKNWNIPD